MSVHNVTEEIARKKHDALQSTVTGTDVVNETGVFHDYAETITIDGSALKAGDIVNIGGFLIIDDLHSTPTLDFKVSATAVVLLQTGDITPVLDKDYFRFDIKLKVLVAGASGKVIWSAIAHSSLNDAQALTDLAVHDGISLAGTTLDMSGNVIIKASGDYAAAHADNESQVLWDVQIIRKTM